MRVACLIFLACLLHTVTLHGHIWPRRPEALPIERACERCSMVSCASADAHVRVHYRACVRSVRRQEAENKLQVLVSFFYHLKFLYIFAFALRMVKRSLSFWLARCEMR